MDLSLGTVLQRNELRGAKKFVWHLRFMIGTYLNISEGAEAA